MTFDIYPVAAGCIFISADASSEVEALRIAKDVGDIMGATLDVEPGYVQVECEICLCDFPGVGTQELMMMIGDEINANGYDARHLDVQLVQHAYAS